MQIFSSDAAMYRESIFHLFGHENIKNLPSKGAYFSLIAEIFRTAGQP